MDKLSSGDDEGADFLSAFKGAFGRATPQEKATKQKHLNERLKAERRAGRTPKERGRVGKGLSRPVQINFRASKETKALLEAIAKKLECSVADVIEQAALAMAKTEKVGVSSNA